MTKTVLKLDIDRRKIINWSRMKIARNITGLKVDFDRSTIHRTGKGWHIRLVVDGKFTDSEICFLQMAFGSDYKREILNMCRVSNGEKNWNVLFERKYKRDRNGDVKMVSEETEADNSIIKKMIGVNK